MDHKLALFEGFKGIFSLFGPYIIKYIQTQIKKIQFWKGEHGRTHTILSFVLWCVCVCGLLRIRERGERRSILVFLIYPTTVYCQSGFLKYVFVQRNQILLKIKLRSPSSFTVWAHSSHKESAGSKFVNILLWNPLEESAAIWKLCVSVSIKRAQVKVKNFLNFLDSVRERNTKT